MAMRPAIRPVMDADDAIGGGWMRGPRVRGRGRRPTDTNDLTVQKCAALHATHTVRAPCLEIAQFRFATWLAAPLLKGPD